MLNVLELTVVYSV